MQIREIMSRSVKTASTSMSLREAARTMEAEDIGFLPVLNEGSLVGVITDRDIAIRGVAHGLDPESTPVRQAMTNDVVMLPENSSLEAAADLMEQRDIRRLVATDGNEQPVGVVTKDRIALYLGAYAMDNGAYRDTEEFPEDFDPARLALEPNPEETQDDDDPAAKAARALRDLGNPRRGDGDSSPDPESRTVAERAIEENHQWRRRG